MSLMFVSATETGYPPSGSLTSSSGRSRDDVQLLHLGKLRTMTGLELILEIFNYPIATAKLHSKRNLYT